VPDVGPKTLRDRTAITRLLILHGYHRTNGAVSQRELAEDLGVTVQAVSTYVQGMAKDGLIEKTDAGLLVPTARGFQSLQEGFRDLKRSVDGVVGDLAVIEATSALAAARARAGERVGLVMESGDLVARAGRPSASTGVAVNDAAPGEEVLVRSLEGVVDLKPSRLLVLGIPGPVEGGLAKLSRRAARAALRDRAPPGAKVAVHGTGAKILAREMGLGPDIEFAPVAAAVNAAERGVPALLLVTSDLLRDALEELDRLNRETLTRVPYEVVVLEK
jgi:putative transcriptional regulator